MVEKVMEKMGYFGGKKEEEEGGVVVLWLLLLLEWRRRWRGEWWWSWWRWWVEMEGRVVEHGRPIGRQGLFLWLPFSLAVGNKEEERKNNERERKKVGVYI